MDRKIELLAPAGNKEIFIKAVDAGADAVYCGIDLYNARMNASNLTMDDLAECCAYAHLRSSKVHLTLNTLVDDMEIDEAVNIAAEAYNAGVDALLVQDIGLACKIRSKYPSIPLHASTQMNIFDKSEYAFLKDTGIRRIVLPRELNMNEISDRTRYASRLGMETEVFVHGAVCICTSGLCLFSSMNKSGTRSGNRGLCAQPCRQEYELEHNGKRLYSGHIISPKDRSAVRYVKDLIEAGVSSLKIEGRMRDADYVVTAVRAYRKLIDSYYDGSLSDELMTDLERELLVNFNRGGGFTSQNLSGEKDPEILSGKHVGKFGLKIGRITLRDCKEGTITIRPSKDAVEPSRGDYLSLRDKDGEIKSFPVGKVSQFKGNYVVKGLHPSSIKDLPSDVNVYLMNHDFASGEDLKRKTSVDISFDASVKGVIKATALVTDGPLKDVFSEDELSYNPEGRESISPERIEEQLRKTGNTAFKVDNVYLSGEEEACCSVKDINELRRGLLESLSSSILSETEHVVSEEFTIPDPLPAGEDREGVVKVLRYYPSVDSFDETKYADILAFSAYDYIDPVKKDRIDEIVSNSGCEFMLVLPDFYHDNTCKLFERTDGIGKMPTAGSNIYNTYSLESFLKRKGEVFISYEVDPRKALIMLENCKVSGDIYLHCGGKVPWMQSDFCPVGRNKKGCSACKGKGFYTMKQESGPDLFVLTHPSDCSSTIYGPSKYYFDESQATDISRMGYNVIKCYTEVENG